MYPLPQSTFSSQKCFLYFKLYKRNEILKNVIDRIYAFYKDIANFPTLYNGCNGINMQVKINKKKS